VLADCRDTLVPHGNHFLGPDQLVPYRTGLVVTGLLRMYLVSADGRQITIRYAGPGYFIGAATTVSGPQQLLVTTGFTAVTDTRVLCLNQDRLRAVAAEADAAVAWALLEQLALYQRDLIHLLAGTAFGSIRQRVAVHLLNLAVTLPQNVGGRLVAPVTQQALADAVGSTRETVARALGELRAAGAIKSVHGGIHLLDPEQLAAEADLGAGVAHPQLGEPLPLGR
jgi:CRP/FNR family cyclic AMP-dependent transcriptional regulator